MINTLQISGVHSQLSEELRAYVLKKIGRLDKYVPKRARESIHVEVKIKEKSARDKRTHQCEVIMKLPKSTITVHKDSTGIIAAIDEVEANLKNQLKKYKDLHAGARVRRHVIARFNRSLPRNPSY